MHVSTGDLHSFATLHYSKSFLRGTDQIFRLLFSAPLEASGSARAHRIALGGARRNVRGCREVGGLEFPARATTIYYRRQRLQLSFSITLRGRE